VGSFKDWIGSSEIELVLQGWIGLIFQGSDSFSGIVFQGSIGLSGTGLVFQGLDAMIFLRIGLRIGWIGFFKGWNLFSQIGIKNG